MKAFLSAFVLSLLTPFASAEFLVMSPFMSYNAGGDRNDTNEVLGARFVVGVSTEVTHLGFYDEGADGLVEAHEVGLFDADTGTEIAVLTVPAGETALLAHNTRWVGLETPVNLVEGEAYVIAARVFEGGDVFLTSDPGVRASSFGEGRIEVGSNVIPIWRSGDGAFSAPTNPLDSSHYNRAYMAGNFGSFRSEEVMTLVVDSSEEWQAIESFGASDAWNIDFVGKYWDESERELMAKRLFGRGVDASGNPEGIGLSGWRFNIGAGSSEQLEASGIVNTTRRTECFLLPDDSYDWTRQAGQQWFLEKAKSYGVESFTAFSNSAPVYFTKNGLARGSNGETNLKDEHYADFAEFLANVLKRFQDEGIPFDFVSPVNEPQFDWDESTQEGSHWEPEEIARLSRELDSALLAKGVTAKQTLDETAQYDYGYSGGKKIVGHVEHYFDPQSSNYVGDLDTVDQSFAGHSYWTANTHQQLVDTREKLADEADKWDVAFRQTEYSLLGLESIWDDRPENDTDVALFMAKVIHADLTIANAVSWAFWTSAEQDQFGHMNRFLLMTLDPTAGDDLSSGGTHRPEKTLWFLGNYSRFIRPGYRRIEISNANDFNGALASAYLSPAKDELVLVLQNLSYQTIGVEIGSELESLPFKYEESHLYLSDREHDLRYMGVVDTAAGVGLPPRSVSSLVVGISGWSDWSAENLGEAPESMRDVAKDPDWDGIRNLLEYVSGRDPLVADEPQSFGMDESAYVFLSDRMARDVELSFEYSQDLDLWRSSLLRLEEGIWSLDSNDLEISQQSIAEGVDELSIRFKGEGSWFGKIRATLK